MFHVSILEQDSTRKRRMNKFTEVPEFEPGNNKEYEVEAIRENIVYAKEADRHLPGLYYLVSWKRYPEEENIWEPASAVQYLWKLLSKFQHENLNRSTATSPPIDTAPPMARLIVKRTEPLKRKQGRSTRRTKKCTK